MVVDLDCCSVGKTDIVKAVYLVDWKVVWLELTMDGN